ncbi:MAG: DUF4340 domain-containing protein [Gemmatimonadetes bacterium]|nr:DUF4340 domain-containing protein [Gemmatimonadota bacterium]MYB69160.1 DUF4340 domain-containing protein [Gemmatimonadota bacterium]
MKFKTNVAIGAVFVVLLAFVYFYEIKGGEERRQEAEKSKQLFVFQEDDAQRLELLRGDDALVLDKGTGGWNLSAPMTDGADQEAVERYLRNLLECEREKVVVDSAAASAEEAAQYGLDAPRLKVRLQTEGGAEQVVAFGADSPTDRFTYAQLQGDNPEIFVVRAWRFDNLDKLAFDLRDRRVLAFAKDEVMQVQRWGAGGAAVLARAEPDWQLREPVIARADADAVNGLLDKIDQAEIEAFVAEDPDADSLAAYGLGERASQVEIALLVGADRAEKRLAIGGADDQGRWYARDASRPQVFLVDSTLVQELTKGISDLRDKEPLRFEREQVERIVLTRGAALAFAADKDTSGVWHLSEPMGRDAKSWKLNSLLSDLEQLEVEDFAEELPAEAASAFSIELLGEGQALLTARFSAAAGTSYLQQEGDDAVYVVSGDDFAELDLDIDDVAQAPKKPVAPAASSEEDPDDGGADSP